MVEHEEIKQDTDNTPWGATAQHHGLGTVAITIHYPSGNVVHHLPVDIANRLMNQIRFAL